MDSQGNYQLDVQQQQFFKAFAKEYLAFLGNVKPTAKQLTGMQNILSHVWIRQAICLDVRLTGREQQCLYLSAQGKSIKEIALFFQVSLRRVVQYRQAIFQKLACNNMTEAVFIGIRYGKINAKLEDKGFDLP